MDSHLDEILRLLAEEERSTVQRLEQLRTEMSQLEAQLQKTRTAIQSLRAAPSPVAPVPQCEVEEERQLYELDDAILNLLSVASSRGFTTNEIVEKLSAAGLGGSGFLIKDVSLLVDCYQRSNTALIRSELTKARRRIARHWLTERGSTYLSLIRKGKRAEALAMLPSSQQADDVLLADQILVILKSHPWPKSLSTLRLELLKLGGYGADLGSRLITQVYHLQTDRLIKQDQEGKWKLHHPTPLRNFAAGDAQQRTVALLQCVDYLGSHECPAILPAMHRELCVRFSPESVPGVQELRRFADQLLTRGLIQATGERTHDTVTVERGVTKLHPHGDEMWQPYQLTDSGKAQFRPLPQPPSERKGKRPPK